MLAVCCWCLGIVPFIPQVTGYFADVAGKNLVVQYQAEGEKEVQCGGGHSELGPKRGEATTFGDPKVPSNRFDPDKGDDAKLISNYKGRNVLKKTDLHCKQEGRMNEDSEFMDISAGFDPFNKAGKNVVVQYQAECEKDVECGGGYLELCPKVCDATTLGDPKVYSSKFGPGKCDYTKLISSCKGRKVLPKADLLCWSAPADARLQPGADAAL